MVTWVIYSIKDVERKYDSFFSFTLNDIIVQLMLVSMILLGAGKSTQSAYWY